VNTTRRAVQEANAEQQRRKQLYDAKQELYQRIGEMNHKIIEFITLAAESDEDHREQFYAMRAINVAKDQKVLKDALKVLDV
jgi:hypothetical protein